MKTERMTMGQAVAAFLKEQYVERDGREGPFFAGVWGIFGHGNVAGLGQALHQTPQLPYYLCRNEQAMVHTAVAFAKMKNRLSTFACTTSIGPGATNMLTGRGISNNQSAASSSFARRHLRAAECRARLTATGVREYAGHLGERCVQTGFALLGPY